jgi:hypothetical protein
MKIYQFQERYLEGLPGKFIFSADTGTGKSIMALELYKRHAYPKTLLIVGPAAKMRTGDWQKAVEDYFGDFMPEVHYYSFEKFSRNPTLKEYARNGETSVWRKWLNDHPLGDFAVIADECHRLANPGSGIGRVMWQVSTATKFFVGLSATPLPNSWLSAANYFKIFGFSKGITDFKKRYCEITTFKGFPQIIGYYREDELKRLWNSISRPLRKADALDLPPVTDIPVKFDASKEYVQVRKEMIFGDKLLDNPSALLHALRQSTMAPKLPWLDEFIEGVSSNIIIFYSYVSERTAILSLLKKKHPKRTVFRQDGERHETPGPERWGELHRTITLAQYQSGSTGIELQYADTIVFFSPQYSYALHHQAIGRIERIGQSSKMTTYSLSARGTIEYEVWACLRGKKDFSEQIWIKENVKQSA